jgi:hypothetical protein
VLAQERALAAKKTDDGGFSTNSAALFAVFYTKRADLNVLRRWQLPPPIALTTTVDPESSDAAPNATEPRTGVWDVVRCGKDWRGS